MQIPNAAVANRGRKTVVERNAPRDKGRTPFVRKDCDPALVYIVSS